MANKKTIRLLALFDYNSSTGFATVSANLVSEWKKTFKHHNKYDLRMDIVAVNYFGDPYTEPDGTRVISGKKSDAAEDAFGRHVFLGSLAQNDYDVIFILQDLGVVVPIVKHLKQIKEDKAKANRPNFKSVFYFPIDGVITQKHVAGIEFFDRLATYTDFGKAEVVRLKPELSKRLNVIPHGTNTKDFFRLDWGVKETVGFRSEYFGEENAQKFIVANINRNQPRKDIPTAILGFVEHWTDYPDSFLYLHMDPNDPLGYKLYDVMAQLPLAEGKDFMFTPERYRGKGMPVEMLNQVYNACDVFLSTATGGGWELTVTEAMAAGLPCIIPDHTSFAEIAEGGKNAVLLQKLHPFVNQCDNIIRYMCDIDEIAQQLRVQHLGWHDNTKSAFKFVQDRSWDWIARRFSDFFIELA